MSIILKTDNLSKQFGSKIAVDNVSMTINKGDIYGFIRKNGAGKLHLCASFLVQQYPPLVRSAYSTEKIGKYAEKDWKFN